MGSQDVLNIVFIISIIVVTGCVVTVTFYLIKVFKSIARLSDNLEDTTQSVKDNLSMKVLAALPTILISLVRSVIQKRRK